VVSAGRQIAAAAETARPIKPKLSVLAPVGHQNC
jgi:hypothetical protein